MSADDQEGTNDLKQVAESGQGEAAETQDNAELQAENTPTDTDGPQAEAEQAEAEQAEAEQAEAEQAEAEQAEAEEIEAEQTDAKEIEQTDQTEEQTEAEQAQTEAEQAQTEAEQAQTEAEQAQTEAEQAQTEAEQVMDPPAEEQTEAEQTEAEAGEAEADPNFNENSNTAENEATDPDQSQETEEKTDAQQSEQQEAGQNSKPGSRSGTPQAQQSKPQTPTSRPGSGRPKSKTPTGSKQPSPVGSKQPSPAGSKPATPAGSKPATPTGSRPPSGSKPPTPAGSKPATPAGSKQATPAGSKEGSRAGTPVGSKKATPAGSKEGSRSGTPPETDEQKATADEPKKAESLKGSRPSSRKSIRSPSQQGQEKDEAKEATEATDSNSTYQEVPPPPPLKSDDTSEEDVQQTPVSNRALNIIWSFGLNINVPILNLSDGSRTVVMYVCAHTGVLYDFRKNTQTLLQGHGNAIRCTCVSEDKRWAATADHGNDNLIIVWDTHTGTPVRTLFEAHPGGTAAVAMTPDAKYLASLSSSMPQTLAIWDWTVEGETPICTAELDPSFGLQNYLYFNPEDITQLVTNSENQVIFYLWEGDNLFWHAPPLSDEDFNKPVGKFSQSIFQEGSTKALTATSLGNLVVWESNKHNNKKQHERKALKLVKLQDRGLNVITVTEKFIVTGDLQGHVKFFDQTLKLVNWYQDLQVGPINAISFAHDPDFSSGSAQGKSYPSDATIHAKPISTQDFVVGTTAAVYAHITTDGTDIEIIHRDHEAPVHGLVAHPKRPFIAVGGHSGLLQVWNYEKRETVVIRRFQHSQISCCNYDPEGQYLAIGFTNGSLRIVDSLSLDDVISDAFCYARDTITHAVFSHNCQYLATADAEFTVSLYKTCYDIGEEQWQYVGRYKSHYKHIKDILFTVHLDSNLPRLMSLGQDRVLVEYDLENSFKDNLKILSMDRIEQSAEPQCMAMYPPVTKESFIVTANDQYKFKLYNSTTKMCRKTLLSPTYGSPVKKIVVLPMMPDGRGHIAYITDNKVGLNILPLDGNPHNAMALIAHPQGVANLVSSYDGKYLFTAGGVDCTVHMWAINIDALHAQAQLGGQDLVPFYGLLDGGRDGDLFKELEDYFYYAQIRSQGVNAPGARETSEIIPVSEIPFVMRAMGFYPSEQEVEDMLNEVKYSTYIDTGSYKTDIELGEFIKLYTNHRPAFGLQPDKLAWAFDVLGFDTINGPAIDRGDLLNLLQTAGEAMTEYELAEYLTTLMGYNEEGGQSELQEFDPDQAGDIIDQNLPHDITAEMFANDLLGFDMYLDYMPNQSGKTSQVSGVVK